MQQKNNAVKIRRKNIQFLVDETGFNFSQLMISL
jgi:hypothetical protein